MRSGRTGWSGEKSLRDLNGWGFILVGPELLESWHGENLGPVSLLRPAEVAPEPLAKMAQLLLHTHSWEWNNIFLPLGNMVPGHLCPMVPLPKDIPRGHLHLGTLPV